MGVDASALKEVFGAREITIRTWLCRSGMQRNKLHVQLDELWENVKDGSHDMLLLASDLKTKLMLLSISSFSLRRSKNRGCDGYHRYQSSDFEQVNTRTK